MAPEKHPNDDYVAQETSRLARRPSTPEVPPFPEDLKKLTPEGVTTTGGVEGGANTQVATGDGTRGDQLEAGQVQTDDGPKAYADAPKESLEAEVERRNADREDDDKIVVEGTGANGNVTKPDVVDALEADDEERAAA